MDDYNPDTDALSVCFNKDGKITMDDKLDSWALLIEGKKIIENNKAEIAAEIAEIAEIKDKLLANPEITDAIEKGELTKKLVKNSIEREFRGLIAKQYNSLGLHGGTINRALDNSIKMSECSI